MTVITIADALKTSTILIPAAFLYLVFRRRQTIGGLFLFLLGLTIFPTILLMAGYNPILTLITAKFRQDIYYGEKAITLLKRLPVFLYLGIPLIVLTGFGILKNLKELIKDTKGIFILIPLLEMILVGLVTRLTSDFSRNMIGISACLILGISFIDNWPKSERLQSILIGINLAFVALTTLL